ncbi:hypothetical protein FSARC_14775 [Fusarium sarcochroum]|uniref:Heterokaryon incompatibility domain-containing protein n=1 Tax=Fusarium sarcochroum TaxID=1208366 RepID=A0A8H4SQX2_9HYPO|nr:hypothetical protein FSARC_14775 [Fusarium sarcochroum]
MEGLPSVSLPESISSCETCLKGENPGSLFGGASFRDLSTSADVGCPACRLRHLGLLKAMGQSAEGRWQQELMLRFDGPIIRITRFSRNHYDANSSVFLYLRPGNNKSLCSVVGIGQEVDHRRSSYIPVITKWLRDCRENHPACPQNTDVFLPKRVLAVGDASSERIQLRVVSGQKGSYTALSHCWGGRIEERTTKRNLRTHEEGLRYYDLPLSFQHAVTVTRDLGLEYLWIDALCIIQDDKSDWEQESGNMAAIYKNAYLVLGADMSPNSQRGFLDVEKGGYHGNGEPIAVVDNGKISVYARREHPRNNSSIGAHPVSREPLSDRAWSLQEQLLASRMVHFTSKEMVWECQSKLLCQCMELDRRSSEPSYQLSLRHFLDLPFPEKFKTWYKLVNEVMQRCIMNPQDTLPCLSGLARHFQEAGAGNYLAGLWYNDLPLGLLWEAAWNSRRVIPYRGPSWSWTSINQYHGPYDTGGGFTDSDTKLKKAYAKILEAKCVPSGEDPLGAVSDGYLKISASLLELTDKIKVSCKYDFELASKEKLYCLFVGEVTCGANGSPVRGLILKQRRDISTTTFERVGQFSLESGGEVELIEGVEDSVVTIV